jgi:hypothetical protein
MSHPCRALQGFHINVLIRAVEEGTLATDQQKYTGVVRPGAFRCLILSCWECVLT